jgi:hypothetical protein
MEVQASADLSRNSKPPCRWFWKLPTSKVGREPARSFLNAFARTEALQSFGMVGLRESAELS